MSSSAKAVQVTEAWARATAPGQDTGAVYLTLTSDQADLLTGLHSDAASGAMLHQSTAQGGMTAMESLVLPPGKAVRLAPRGGHIMLMGLRHALVAGGHVKLDLAFQHAPAMHVEVPVLPIGATGPAPP